MGGLALILSEIPAAHAATERVVHAFHGGFTDGANPYARLLNLLGTLYGTSYYAGGRGCPGTDGCGTVFKLTPPRSLGGAWSESLLYSFGGGGDGAYPYGGLIPVGGTLIGTTFDGGENGSGTVFALEPPAVFGRVWRKRVLYAFKGGSDGANPQGVLSNIDGALYGTTDRGGRNGVGTVFALAPPAFAGGAWTESVLYAFAGAEDGANPQDGVLDVRGTLYGTTRHGGAYGVGTVFALAPPAFPGGLWRKRVLHAFTGGNDGVFPLGRLINLGGTFYGTTFEGGANGAGTVFALAPPPFPGRTWTEKAIYAFAGGRDGANPEGGVIHVGSELYGTTHFGGAYGGGKAFKLTPPVFPGGLWTHRVLHAFGGPPMAPNPMPV